MKYKLFFALLIILNINFVNGQKLMEGLNGPLFSYQLGESVFTSSNPSGKIKTSMSTYDTIQSDLHAQISFVNISPDTLILQNIIPFTKDKS